MPSTNSPAQNKNKKPNWFMRLALWKRITIIGLSVIIIMFGVIMLATDASTKVSDEFLNHIQASKSDEAYEHLSNGAKSTITRSDFKSVVDQIGPILNTQEKQVSRSASAETGSDPKATVVYEIKGNDGITYTLTINLTQEGGEWKVLNFESTKK